MGAERYFARHQKIRAREIEELREGFVRLQGTGFSDFAEGLRVFGETLKKCAEAFADLAEFSIPGWLSQRVVIATEIMTWGVPEQWADWIVGYIPRWYLRKMTWEVR